MHTSGLRWLLFLKELYPQHEKIIEPIDLSHLRYLDNTNAFIPPTYMDILIGQTVHILYSQTLCEDNLIILVN